METDFAAVFLIFGKNFLKKIQEKKRKFPICGEYIYVGGDKNMKKDFIVRQQDLKDCGVCCLLSIIKYYKGYVPIEKLRIDTQTSREGTTAYHLVEAAKKYGFDSFGMKLESIDEVKDIVMPVIAHVVHENFNHFVVIYKVTLKDIYLMDPAKGKVKMTKKDFESIWSKNILLFSPKYSIPNLHHENHLLTIVTKILLKEKKIILKILFLTAIFTFLTILTGFFFKIGLGFITDGIDKMTFYSFILLFLLLYVLKIGLSYFRNWLKTYLNKNFDGLLYYDFLSHLFSLPNYFIKDRTTGEIMIRVKELENIKSVFSEILVTIILDSILALAVGIILYSLDKTLFFILCLFVLVYIVWGVISGRLLYKRALDVNECEIGFQENMVEDIDSFITLKNLNVTKILFKKLENKLFKYLHSSYDLNKTVLNASSVTYSLEELLTFTIIALGMVEILNGNLNLANLITFDSLLIFFINPFKNVINILPSYNYVKVEMIKLNDFYNVEEEQENVGYQEFFPGDITVSNLNFSYNPFTSVFKDFNMVIKQNSFVLFKGTSGCGKSTLCQIICRLKECSTSNIKIGNVSINDYSLETIRKNITYVSQKENLIQDTIKNNMLLGREIPEEKIKTISELCLLESIVSKKPLRYETYLEKDSINLSGGEKQRIILARALLNDFQILILDEALSELNNELEIEIIKNIKNYFKDKTIIYVSHKEHDEYFDKVYDFGGNLCMRH